MLLNSWLSLNPNSVGDLTLRQKPPQTFEGKVVLITGSSQGIGMELAIQLAQKGAKIVLNARNEAKLEMVRNDLLLLGADVIACAGDVGNSDDCEHLVNTALQKYGQIDVLINNAGIGVESVMEQLQPIVLRKVVETNFLGSIYCTYYALPHIKRTKGSIMFVGSIAGIHGIPLSNVYAATKMALTSLAESLRIETYSSQIHIGIAYLGFTQNDPGKQQIGPDGSLLPCPKRDQAFVSPVDKVAKGIIQMIEKRQHKRVFSKLGKILLFLNRISPELVSRVLRYQFAQLNSH